MIRRVPISEAKLKGLAQALDAGPVKFKNGAVIERVIEVTGKGEDEKQERVLLVTRPETGGAIFTALELRPAYELALYGPKKPQPPGDPEKFGDVPY